MPWVAGQMHQGVAGWLQGTRGEGSRAGSWCLGRERLPWVEGQMHQVAVGWLQGNLGEESLQDRCM